MTTPEMLAQAYAGNRVAPQDVPPALAGQTYASASATPPPALVIPGALDAAAAQAEQVPPSPEVDYEPKVMTVAGEEVFDFSTGRKNIKFKIDDDFFEATRELPGLAGIEVAAYATQLDNAAQMDVDAIKEVVIKIFNLVLMPTSAELMIRRLSDQTNPVGVETMNNVMQWLMGRYGLRPTAPSAPSPTGS